MGYVVKMPKLGLEMEQGTLLKWYVEESETVEEGETIAEVESEKSIGEVDAREDGVLRFIGLEEGTTVPPGAPIGIVAEADEDIADLEAEFETTDEDSAEPAETDVSADETAASASESGTDEAETAETASASTDVRASPKAKHRADELGVDITGVDGSGPQGAITADDVEDAAEAASAEAAPEEGTSDTIETERAAATPEGNYHTTTHVTHGREADALIEATEMAANAFEFDVDVSDVLLLAVSSALDNHPEFNATFEDETHHLHERQDIAIVRDDSEGETAEAMIATVDERTFADVVEASHDREGPAGDGRSGTRATFALANGEDCGDVQNVVTPPTVAGLVADCSYRRAVPAENGVEFRRYLRLSLAYDSRAVGDRDVDAFLESLLKHVEAVPELLLRTYG